jgi:hypothetical protein
MSPGPRLVEQHSNPFDRIEDILADIAAGRMVVRRASAAGSSA